MQAEDGNAAEKVKMKESVKMTEEKNTFNDIRDQQDIHQKGDHAIFAEACKGQLRLIAVDLTASMKSLRDLHDLSPAACVAMGELALTGMILAGDLKDKDAWLSLILQTDGDLGKVVVECRQNMTLRAKTSSPHPKVHLNAAKQLDINANIGTGRLAVLRSFGANEPFVSRIPWQQQGLTQTLAYYLAKSEQRRSCLILQVGMDKNGITFAWGFLLEALPAATEQTLNYLEQRINNMPAVSWFYENKFDPAQVLDMLVMDPAIKYLACLPISLSCSCSVAKMKAALAALNKRDLQDLAKKEHLTLACEYCHRQYTFTAADLQELLQATEQKPVEQKAAQQSAKPGTAATTDAGKLEKSK